MSTPCICHISVGTNQFDNAVNFYDQVMDALGCKRLYSYPGAAAYGRDFPEFWVQKPVNEDLATVGNGYHVGLFAGSKEQVDAFYQAAITAGGQDEGAPGPRPLYGPAYYGAFVRDLDGHKIEASYIDTSKL